MTVAKDILQAGELPEKSPDSINSFSSPLLKSAIDKELRSLNSYQQEAVLHKDGPLLVVAGAGSGKTKVATVRIAKLIESGVPPEQIIGVTFTNKAAREMKERVHNLVGCSVVISTFHSLGLKILRESAHHIGYGANSLVYDADDSLRALKLVLKELSIPDDDAALYEKSISTLKNRLVSPSSEQLGKNIENARILSVYERYSALLKRSGAFDFDDLLFLPVLLFRSCPEVLKEYQERWKYLLVDEYQDTNYAQSVLVSYLAGTQQNVFAVGDPDQSIYSWRGADIGNILRFPSEYEDSKLVRLEENYRSTQAILTASNYLIEHNKGRIEKRLWSKKNEGESVVLYCGKTERQESEFVASAIEEYIENGYLPEEIAVLFRTNAQSRALEDSFLERRIPYHIYGGISFYQRKEVKDILSYLRLVLQPKDSLAFARAIQAPKRGLGGQSISKIETLAVQLGLSFHEVVRKILAGELSVSFGTKQKQALESFATTLDLIAAAQESGIGGCIDAVVFDGGYLKSLESDSETYQEKAEIVSELVAKAHEWDRLKKGPPLQFLEEVTLNQATDEQKESSCFLMTIHNAKGLEFKIVFVVGLEEDILPHINSKKTLDGIEEERRLLYVAMTRAKVRLILTCSETRLLWGGFRSMRPSQFLYEIPKQYLHLVKNIDALFSKNELYQSSSKSSSSKTFATAKAPAPSELEVGQIVMHTYFGVGRIEKRIESPDGIIYQVYFSGDGSRKKILGTLGLLSPVA